MTGIAIIGAGNIGMGVDSLVSRTNDLRQKRALDAFEVLYLVDIRPIDDPRHTLDLTAPLADPRVNVVVETIGGIGAALSLTRQALAAGRHVVTSNKQLVAEHGRELQELAKQNGVEYRFEAAVGGGIPIITALREGTPANGITRISGILNGTTNYILTRMEKEGMTFEACLAEAQKLGYAEPVPDADVLGFDTANKLCILVGLTMGYEVMPRDITVQGITKITLGQIYRARAKGFTYKLLGCADRTADGVNLFVAPVLVPLTHPLALVQGVYNAISAWGEATGEWMLYGRGAGADPTAAAVLADVWACGHAAPLALWHDAGITSHTSIIKEALETE